jgi:hypothetical protein
MDTKPVARKKSYENGTSVEQHQAPSIIQLTSEEIINHPGKQRPISLRRREILQSQVANVWISRKRG